MARTDTRHIDLREQIEKIRQIENCEEIYIFGSRKYKTRSLRSDIDLLIYAPEGLSRNEITNIIRSENSLDIFETTDKKVARSFANDSFLRRDNLISTLDAELIWSKEQGYSDNIKMYADITVLRNHDFKMSSMPQHSEEEAKFYRTYGYDAIFVIMDFEESLSEIYNIIVSFFKEKKLTAVRAKEAEFASNLWENTKVYLECCSTAVAIFDKGKTNGDSEEPIYNPNVAIEVGYMLCKRSTICILKDKDLKELPTDLSARLYKEYDSDNLKYTVTQALESWCSDNLFFISKDINSPSAASASQPSPASSST